MTLQQNFMNTILLPFWMFMTPGECLSQWVLIKCDKKDIVNYRPIYYNSYESTAKIIRYNNR